MCLSYLSIHCTQCSSTWWGWNNDEIARTEECECTNKIRRKRWHEGATATGWIRRRMLCPLQILDYLYCRWTLPQRSPNEIKEEDCLSCMQAYYGLTQAPNYQLQSLYASFLFSFFFIVRQSNFLWLIKKKECYNGAYQRVQYCQTKK